MFKKLILVVLLAVISNLTNYSIAGKIYSWKDENGQMHFGTTPPVNVQTKNTGISSKGNNSRYYQPKKNYYSQKLKELETKNKTTQLNKYSRTQQLNSNRYNNTVPKNLNLKKDWRQEIISKCKANRGIDCTNSRYVNSKRPLSKDEKDALQRARLNRLHAR